MAEDAEGVVAEAFPGGFDLGYDYDAEEDEPGVLELDGDGPEDAWEMLVQIIVSFRDLAYLCSSSRSTVEQRWG